MLETLGSRLRYIREKKGIKQNHAAKKVGIAAPTLANYEKDFRAPDNETLNKLADLYEVTTDWLYGREEKEKVQDEELISVNDFIKLMERGAPLKDNIPATPEDRKKIVAILRSFLPEDDGEQK